MGGSSVSSGSSGSSESVDESVATRVEGRRDLASTSLAQVDSGARTPGGPTGGGVFASDGKLGRYSLLRELGAGAMGQVFLAYDVELDRRVALKILRPELGSSMGAARLLREAQALARLNHPNVVHVYEVGEVGGEIFMAMEYVPGVDLRTWLKDRKLVKRSASRAQVDELLSLMIQAGRGLAAAHAAGLAHRDVKPDNILIGDDGRVRMGDFGLARTDEFADTLASENGGTSVSTLNVTLTRIGSTPGTPAYMAPEQREGAFDSRSDLFSLGVTIWEAVMGVRPFSGRKAELSKRIAMGERRPPPDGHAAPRWLVQALVRCLDPDPERRFGSVDEFLSELLRAPGRRLRLGFAAAASAVVIAASAGTWVHEQHVETACASAGAELEETWEGEARPRLAAAMQSVEASYAADASTRTASWLDRYVDDWSAARSEACFRGRSERWSAVLTGKVDACLEERRHHFDALVESLAAGGEGALRRAVSAAASLPSISVCVDPLWVERWSPSEGEGRAESDVLRGQLAKAAAEYAAGRYEGAATQANSTRDAAAALDLEPLAAEAELLAGRALHRSGDKGGAVERLERAFVAAGHLGFDRVALDAALGLADRRSIGEEGLPWCLVAEGLLPQVEPRPGVRTLRRARICGERLQELGRHDDVKALLDEAMPAIANVGEVHPASAGVYNTLAKALASLRDYEGALAANDRVIEIEGAVVGARHPDMIAVHNTRGQILVEAGRLEDALLSFHQALKLQEEVFGEDHIDTATLVMNLGILRRMSGDFDGAREALADALARAERKLADDDVRRLQFLGNLAQIETESGAHEAAEATFRRAQIWAEAHLAPDNPRFVRLLAKRGWAALESGDTKTAELFLLRALPQMEAVVGAAHHDTIFALAHMGSLLVEQGRMDEAEPYVERALAGMTSGRLAADRAWVRFDLAQIREASGRRDDAVAIAREAAGVLVESGPDWAEKSREIERWIADRPATK